MAKENKEAVNPEEEKTAEEVNTASEEETSVKEEPDELEKLRAEKDELNDKYLRVLAEYDNFRKRSQKEKESIYNDSKADAVSKIIPVIDNFERAAAAEASAEDYKKGIEMTVKQLIDTLSALGVEAFGEAGETFDPNIHNGVSHIDDENLGENVIANVYQKGYKIGDRIIRHAVVIVAN